VSKLALDFIAGPARQTAGCSNTLVFHIAALQRSLKGHAMVFRRVDYTRALPLTQIGGCERTGNTFEKIDFL
jgi:hypothetical protein